MGLHVASPWIVVSMCVEAKQAAASTIPQRVILIMQSSVGMATAWCVSSRSDPACCTAAQTVSMPAAACCMQVPAHKAAIQQHGPCPVHRRSFEPIKSLTKWPGYPKPPGAAAGTVTLARCARGAGSGAAGVKPPAIG